MRILIVEDDRKLARQLQKGLSEQGHAVTVASEGTEGLEAAQYGEFDVLVLDVMNRAGVEQLGMVTQPRELNARPRR